MKYQSMINVVAGASLILAPLGAMASAGWAFNNPNIPVVEQGAGSGEKQAHSKTGRYDGPGWAFNNPNVSEVEQGAGSGEKKAHKKEDRSGGPGWAFDHPHEPVQGSASHS